MSENGSTVPFVLPRDTAKPMSELGGGAGTNEMNRPKYEVALSFAGEQRPYVEEVAKHLQRWSVAVFYDGFERNNLWGCNATEAFHEVFARNSNYVVMFISNEYVQKWWPRHERRSALSRMICESSEFILPIRFDKSVVPGLPDDLIYISANDYASPAELATEICEKIGVERFRGKASEASPPTMTSSSGEAVFDYSSYNGHYIIGRGSLEFETKWSKASNTSIHIYNDPASIHGIALAKGCESISKVSSTNALDFTSRSRTSCIGEVVVLRNAHGFYAAVQILEIKDDSRGAERDELRFRYAIQPDGSDNFEEFEDL